MTNDEVQEIIDRAEDEHDRLKDRVHEQYDEIERLNSIINEFEVWLNDKYEEMHDIWYIKVLNKLKELKGSDKE